MGWLGDWRGGITAPLPRAGALPAGAGSALLFALALPPHPLPILLFPAFLLLAEAVRRLPRGVAGLRPGALLGAFFGGLHSLLVLHWLPSAGGSQLGPMAFPAAVGVWGLHAVVGMVVLGAVAAARIPRPLALIPGWAVLVWLPGVIPILGVPWPGPELALVEWPRFAALLPLLGSGGVGALMAGAIAGLLAMGRAGIAMALFIPLVWGLVEARSEPGLPGSGSGEGGGPRVALVEMAFPPSVVQDPSEREAQILEAMSRLSLDGWDSDEDPEGHPKAAPYEAWPEAPVPPSTATNGGGERSEDPYLSALQTRVERRQVSLVTGSHVVREGLRRNGVLRLEAGGEIRSVHEKRRLVPGVERTTLLGQGRPGRGLAPGSHRPPFSWAGRSVGALVCFEILFPGEVARLRREGALLLLQLSNDSALRPDAGRFPVFLDAGRRQHEAFLRARATEFALPALRSVMGGRAGGWDARGQALPELQRWGAREIAFVVVRVPETGPIPPAAWLSPLTGPVAAAVLLLALSLRGLPRARRVTPRGQVAVP